MRVLRGRAGDPAADDRATGAMLERAAEDGDRVLRVWRPDRHLSFARRDARADGYERARAVAEAMGFPPVERRTGGRPVAYTGTTVAFVLARPVEDVRARIAERYEEATGALQRALWKLGVPAQRGEPEGAFCSGNHSLQWKGKVAGLAQRVSAGAALVGGVVIVRDHDGIAEVLAPVYDALAVPFDPGSVGSVERAGGRADPDTVVEAVEAALVGDREAEYGEV